MLASRGDCSPTHAFEIKQGEPNVEDLRGRVAVVTGAASGIGRAMAEKFRAEGMKVVLGDIVAEGLAETAASIEQAGGEVVSLPVDVTREDSVEAFAGAAFDAFGAVHVLCNNAGVLTAGTCWELPAKDYEWLLAVNTMGPVHGVRSFVPRLIAQDEPAHIVNTASMAALTSLPFAGAYHMTKHAVLAFSEVLYHELTLTAPKIGVSVLCPELIQTGIADSERCRPDAFKKSADESQLSTSGDMVVKALSEGMAKGLDPSVMADRVVDAILANRFYILGEGSWRDAAFTRLDDIREGRNPTFSVPT